MTATNDFDRRLAEFLDAGPARPPERTIMFALDHAAAHPRRRDVFAARRYGSAPNTYRGHCQKLGLRLAAEGVCVRFVPEARTIHRFPDRRRELFTLRLLRGADTVEMARPLGDALLPRPLRPLSHLGAASALGVLAIRFGMSARALGKQDMSELRGVRRAAGIVANVLMAAWIVSGVAFTSSRRR